MEKEIKAQQYSKYGHRKFIDGNREKRFNG